NKQSASVPLPAESTKRLRSRAASGLLSRLARLTPPWNGQQSKYQRKARSKSNTEQESHQLFHNASLSKTVHTRDQLRQWVFTNPLVEARDSSKSVSIEESSRRCCHGILFGGGPAGKGGQTERRSNGEGFRWLTAGPAAFASKDNCCCGSRVWLLNSDQQLSIKLAELSSCCISGAALLLYEAATAFAKLETQQVERNCRKPKSSGSPEFWDCPGRNREFPLNNCSHNSPRPNATRITAEAEPAAEMRQLQQQGRCQSSAAEMLASAAFGLHSAGGPPQCAGDLRPGALPAHPAGLPAPVRGGQRAAAHESWTTTSWTGPSSGGSESPALGGRRASRAKHTDALRRGEAFLQDYRAAMSKEFAETLTDRCQSAANQSAALDGLRGFRREFDPNAMAAHNAGAAVLRLGGRDGPVHGYRNNLARGSRERCASIRNGAGATPTFRGSAIQSSCRRPWPTAAAAEAKSAPLCRQTFDCVAASCDDQQQPQQQRTPQELAGIPTKFPGTTEYKDRYLRPKNGEH
uniref:Protein kinase domain-containing protein n=1 Tax=Macrostomum lignano TaxID=282301 RepID=A0A1I8F6I8_9PLAT